MSPLNIKKNEIWSRISWTKSNLIDNLPRTAVKGLTPSSKIDTPVMLEIVPNKNASFGLKKA